MADNILTRLLSGGAANIATDEIGSVHHQRVKVQHGADGAATDVSAASPLPVVQTGALPAGSANIGDVDVLTLAGASAAALGDATANPTLVGVGAFGMQWDPRTGTWHRETSSPRELEYADVLASAARTATVLGPSTPTRGARGVIWLLDVTAVPGSGADLTLAMIYHVLSSAGVTVSVSTMTVTRVTGAARWFFGAYPGASYTGTRTQITSLPAVPARVAIQVIHGDANSWTYSAGGVLLP